MSIKQQIRRYEQTEVQSRMQNILMQWLLESRQLYGQFPIYPTKDVNGSAMLFKEMSVVDVQEFVNKVDYDCSFFEQNRFSNSPSKRKH